MGCISSKRAGAESDYPPPASAIDDKEESRVKRSGSHRHVINGQRQRKTPLLPPMYEDEEEEERAEKERNGNNKSLNGKKTMSISNVSMGLRNGCVNNNHVAAEQAAAGWPGWLTAVAGEAIQGWVPLRADGFEKLEKIGQGTYSSVFKARENATGKLFALKKVKFDNYHPESVRFMAREITILRKLDHPNILKLHGLITSKVSSSIYLVLEYMEHDLSGLLSSPDVTFTEPQIKCFMQQILYGLEYCHRRGVMHRDIKTSNILLNNEGVLKLGDFGLANFMSTRYKQPLTSRVVTLWYRPPELLLGSTNYGAYVDMWSAGCVFAEVLIGKPILKGKTEVEQLHKIFKLCGSPSDEYWTKSKLPHSTMFRPQDPYESSLRERFQSFPEPAVSLLETLLSVEPQNRGTAATALNTSYFTTMPYACDPSSLPKYPPNKEIDAKYREDTQRRRTGGLKDSSSSSRMHKRGRKGLPEPSSFSMLGRPALEEPQVNRKYARRNGANALVNQVRKDDDEISIDMKSDVSHVTNASQGSMIFAGNGSKSAALASLAKRRMENNKNNYYSINRMDPQHEELADVEENRENNSNYRAKYAPHRLNSRFREQETTDPER